MRLSKRPRRAAPLPSLSNDPSLEVRCLLAVLSFIGQDGNDYVGPDAGVGPDGIQDLHIKITGLDASAQISSVGVSGPAGSGFKWQSGINTGGASDAYFVRDPNDATIGHLYINPRVRSNLDPTVSAGSSTGSLIDLASGTSGTPLSVTIQYADRSETITSRVANLTSPTLAMPVASIPSANSTALTVKNARMDDQGYAHVTVTGLAAAGLTANASETRWVISNQVGTVWYNQSGAHNYLTVNRIDADSVEIVFKPTRDDSSSPANVISGPTLLLTGWKMSDAGKLYLSQFKGPAWNPDLQVDDSTSAYVSTEDQLRDALNKRIPTIYLSPPEGTDTIVVRQPLRVLGSTRIVGNGATLLFDQGNTAAWPAEVAGAIYVANPGVSEIALHLENFAIKFADTPLRWANPLNLPTPTWDPMNNIFGLERAVIHTGDGAHVDINGDGVADINQGNDNRNRTDLRLDRMDITGPPVFNSTPPPGPRSDPHGFGYEAAIELSIDIISTNVYDRGEITNSTFRGGQISVAGGPWTITDNVVKGALAGAYSPSAFVVSNGHDVSIQRNKVYQEDPNGRIARLALLANRGVNTTISDNQFFGGAGMVGTESVYVKSLQRYDGMNASEVILTESTNYVAFEGVPSAISSDGRLVTIRDNYNRIDGSWGATRAGAGLVVSVLSSPDPSFVGKWAQISHLVSLTPVTPGTTGGAQMATFLLQEAIPGLPAGSVISICDSFVGTTISNNLLDLTNKSSTGIVLAGANFGTKVEDNTIIGGTIYKYPYTGMAVWVTAYPTNPATVNGTTVNPWGWTHTPSFDVTVRGNAIWNSIGGINVSNDYSYNNSKSSTGRTYVTADVADNRFYWDQSFYNDNQYILTDSRFFPTVTIGAGFRGGPSPRDYSPVPQTERPHPWTVGGQQGFIDPTDVRATVSGNRAFIAGSNGTITQQPSLTGQVYAGIVNGVEYSPDAPKSIVYNFRNLDIAGASSPAPRLETDKTIDDTPISDMSGGYSATGPWKSTTATVDQGYLGDFSAAPAVGRSANPTAVATWTFDNMAPGRYQVFVTWKAGNDRATDAPFTVKDGSVTVGSVRVNQQDGASAPSFYDAQGLPWWTLGGANAAYDLVGNRLVVQLANNASTGAGGADAYVVADGIRIVRVGDSLTLDNTQEGNGDAGFALTGRWDYFTVPQDQSYLGDLSAALVVGPNAAPTATATWTFTNLAPGRYRILGSWQPSDNRSPDAPFTIKDGANTLGTVRMNQRHDSPIYADYYDTDSRPWWTLGGSGATFDITGSSAQVILSNNASASPGYSHAYVIADGIRLERIGDIPISQDPVTLDNTKEGDGSEGFALTGRWDYFTVPQDQSYLGDLSAALVVGPNAAPTATATWTFTNLAPGRYRILGSWQPSDNRSPDAPFTIKDGANTLGTVRMNQRHDSPIYADYYDTDSRPWWTLGGSGATFDITGSSAQVILSNNASASPGYSHAYVIADGIRLERIGDIPASTNTAATSTATPANNIKALTEDPGIGTNISPAGTGTTPILPIAPVPATPQFRRAAAISRLQQWKEATPARPLRGRQPLKGLGVKRPLV